MNVKTVSIVVGCVMVCVLSACAVSAAGVNDNTNDVWHWSQTGTAWAWSGNVADKPNIDITQLTDTVNGEKITLSMTVAGSIENSEKIVYWMYYNSTDANYWITWSNGSGMGYASKINFTNPVGSVETPDNVNATGNTVTAIFTAMGNATPQKLWGWAAQYTTLGDQTNEWWGDWAPDTQAPSFVQPGGDNTSGNPSGDNTNGTSSGKQTPGFEVIPAVAAIAVTILILRRRR